MEGTQLARILDRLVAQEAQLAELRADVRRRSSRARRRRMVAIAAVALLLALLPTVAWGAAFVDLNPGSPHNADINLIADAGISRGCTDTAHYCPNAYVTREQMASFLARTAGLGGNPPVANAAELGGVGAYAFAQRTEFHAFEVFAPATGPLPRTSAPKRLDGGPVMIVVGGSGYRATPGSLGLQLELTTPGSAPILLDYHSFTNEAHSHKALVTGIRVLVNLAPGDYTFTLRARG
jgi:hypothetical protein